MSEPIRLPWRRRPAETTAEITEALKRFHAATIAVQISLRDCLTPAIRDLAITFEIFGAQASGEWNRYQMVGWRRTPLPGSRTAH